MSFRKLFQLSLIGAALLVAKAADGQPLQGICQAKVKVNSVKYLGKQSGQDQVEVRWSTEAASACIKFGAGGSNLPSAQQDSFTAPAAAGFEVRVFVKRRFDHSDDAAVTKKEIVPAGSSVLTIVNIPRGVAETDPQAYIVTASSFNPAAPACATYGVPPINTFGQGVFGGGVSNNISVQQGFGDGTTSQGFGYELTVTITRRFGHQDTGTAKSSNIFRGKITTVVQIPGAAETDPVKYDVTINTTFGGLTRRTLTAQGNGAPALASATQTLANSSFAPANQQGFGGGNATADICFPSVSITGLSFTPGSSTTPDTVTIGWTASHSPSDCFIGPKVAISVEVKRPDNSTATSVLLTFGGLINKQPAEATWCGDLVRATPDLGMKCDPTKVFGLLPQRYNQSRLSGNNAYTDIMSITSQVARRAYLDAVKGATSTFFYVRRFVSTVGGPDEYVPVTIRLSGNGARVPLSLTEVKLTWGVGKPILFVKTNEKLPRFQAEITYTGTGRLQGRWELVKPGETPPEPRDLLTEATLPFEERGTQKKYTQLSRFNIYLPPTGKIVLPGPEAWRVDKSLNGLYLVLLRIGASDDKEGDTNLGAVGAGAGVVHGGAVAGFSLPVLKYYVSNDNAQPRASRQGVTPTSPMLTQLSPEERVVLPTDKPVDFTWTLTDNATTYRLEVEDLQGGSIVAAILMRDVSNYRAPSWLKDKVGDAAARWRVIAFDQAGKQIGQTEWRSLRFGGGQK